MVRTLEMTSTTQDSPLHRSGEQSAHPNETRSFSISTTSRGPGTARVVVPSPPLVGPGGAHMARGRSRMHLGMLNSPIVDLRAGRDLKETFSSKSLLLDFYEALPEQLAIGVPVA